MSYVAALFPRRTGLLFGSLDVFSIIQITQGFRGSPTLIIPLWGWVIVLFEFRDPDGNLLEVCRSECLLGRGRPEGVGTSPTKKPQGPAPASTLL